MPAAPGSNHTATPPPPTTVSPVPNLKVSVLSVLPRRDMINTCFCAVCVCVCLKCGRFVIVFLYHPACERCVCVFFFVFSYRPGGAKCTKELRKRPCIAASAPGRFLNLHNRSVSDGGLLALLRYYIYHLRYLPITFVITFAFQLTLPEFLHPAVFWNTRVVTGVFPCPPTRY